MYTLFKRLIITIDLISEWVGRVSAWLIMALVLLVGYDVMMRYLFSSGAVMIQELEWHLFGMIFLLGAAYTLKYDDHVRVDILYRSGWMNDLRRAWLNLLGGLLFLIPFCLWIIITAWPIVVRSYTTGEGSPDGGLSRFWFIKSFIVTGFVLLFLQGIAEILRNLLKIIYKEDIA